MKLRISYWITILFSLVMISQESSLHEPLENLRIISRLLTSISIRNGINTGYPNFHDTISDILNISTRQSLLDFLDLNFDSLPNDLRNFSGSIKNIEFVVIQKPNILLNALWNIVNMKKYEDRLNEINEMKMEINKTQETLNGVYDQLNTVPTTKQFNDLTSLLKQLDSETIPDELLKKIKEILESIDKISGLREINHFALKKSLVTFRLLLDLSESFNKLIVEWKSIKPELENVKSHLPDILTSASCQRSQFKMPIVLRDVIEVIDAMKSSPESREQFDRLYESDMTNRWLNSIVAEDKGLDPLENLMEPIVNLVNRVTEIKESFRYYVKYFDGNGKVEAIQAAQKHGDRINQLNEVEIRDTIDCILKFNGDYKVYSDHEKYNDFLKSIEKPVETIGKAIEEMLFGLKFNKIGGILEKMKGILEDDSMEVEAKIEKIRAVWVELDEILPSIISTLAFSRSVPNINVDETTLNDSVDNFNKIITQSNIKGMLNSINYASIYNLEQVILFLNNANRIIDTKFIDTIGNLSKYQGKLIAIVKETEESEELDFEGIKYINEIRDDFSRGIKALEYFGETIDRLNRTTMPETFIKDMLVFNQFNFSIEIEFELKKVFEAASKVRDLEVEVTDEYLNTNDFNSHLNNIRVALKSVNKVKELINSVFNPVPKGNTLKEGLLDGEPNKFQPTSWYMYLFIYPHELLVLAFLLILSTLCMMIEKRLRKRL